jgi:hypothetical protein
MCNRKNKVNFAVFGLTADGKRGSDLVFADKDQSKSHLVVASNDLQGHDIPVHIPPYWFVDYFPNKVVDNILDRGSDSWMRKMALAHFGT